MQSFICWLSNLCASSPNHIHSSFISILRVIPLIFFYISWATWFISHLNHSFFHFKPTTICPYTYFIYCCLLWIGKKSRNVYWKGWFSNPSIFPKIDYFSYSYFSHHIFIKQLTLFSFFTHLPHIPLPSRVILCFTSYI